jgi:hypothetical protein
LHLKQTLTRTLAARGTGTILRGCVVVNEHGQRKSSDSVVKTWLTVLPINPILLPLNPSGSLENELFCIAHRP